MMNRMASMMAAMGRNGDTTVGHLTPGEVVIPQGVMTPKLMSAFLEAMDAAGERPGRFVVGQGSRNPLTGVQEFWGGDDPSDSSSGQNDISGGGGFGGGADVGSGGSQGGGYGGSYGGSYGGYGSTAGSENAAHGENQSSTAGRDAAYGGGWGGAGSGGGDFTDLTPEKEKAIEADLEKEFAENPDIFGEPQKSVVESVWDALTNPNTMFDKPTAKTPGIVGTMLGVTTPFGFAPSVVGAVRSATSPDLWGDSYDQGNDSDDATGNGAVMITPPPKEEKPKFTRPGQIPIPAWLGLSSAMTPLQLRSAIATHGTSGDDSRFRSDDAQALYRNLLERVLIDDQGNLGSLDSLLPVDFSYLQRTLGTDRPETTEALLQAIARQ